MTLEGRDRSLRIGSFVVGVGHRLEGGELAVKHRAGHIEKIKTRSSVTR
ncbi:MAG: hypothetical protein R2849_00045 [Thermomicrobiales bacterium]